MRSAALGAAILLISCGASRRVADAGPDSDSDADSDTGSSTETDAGMDPGRKCMADDCHTVCRDGLDSCSTVCLPGGSCTLECGDAGTCGGVCMQDASCDVDCEAAGTCVVQCFSGARCRCVGETCLLRCDDAIVVACADGSQVCGRPCP